MGVLIDVVKDLEHNPQVSDEIKEALALLVELAKEKAYTGECEIKIDLQTGKTPDDIIVPINKILKNITEYRVISETSGNIIDEIYKSLGYIFIGNSKILKSISEVVKTALDIIVGAQEGQEYQTHFCCVVAEYPAIMRFDFYFWGRNTRCESILKYIKTAFACVCYKSVVDVSKLDFSSFLVLYAPILKRAFDNNESMMKGMIEETKEIFKLFNVNIDPKDADVSRIANAIIEGSYTDSKGNRMNDKIFPKVQTLPLSACGIF